MEIKNTLLLLSTLLLLLQSCEPAKTDPTPPTSDTTKVDSEVVQKLAPTFNSPEGVISDGEFLFVSNVGVKLAPTEKDGDGRIMQLSLDGKEWLEKEKWAAIEFNAPKGMAIVGKMLYVADIDRVVEIDLKTISQNYVYDFSRFGVNFLNDICVKDDQTLYVSATDANAIFEVNLVDQNLGILGTGELRGPNGIVYASEENKIYCAEYGTEDQPNGRLVAIDAENGTVNPLIEHEGYLDGLAMTAAGELLFSDWVDGKLHKMKMTDNSLSIVPFDSVGGPADFHYISGENKVWLPCMQESKLKLVEGI